MSNDSDLPKRAVEYMQANLDGLARTSPWSRRLGFRLTRLEAGHVWGLQPWKEHLVGDPETGVLHGGVLTGFLDTLCGMASSSALPEPRFVATLDLRIDYMRPAKPHQDILGEAECYHYTKNITFTRRWAYHESRDKLIASAAGAFAINRSRMSFTGDAQNAG